MTDCAKRPKTVREVRIRSVLMIALFPIFAAGCSAEKEEPEGILPKGYTDALEKAENVEDFLKDSQKKRLEEID